MLAALILLVIAASFLSHRFLTVPNLMNVLRQVSIVGILAIGMTFVILARGIDLSVGSILGIAVVLFAGSMDSRGMIVAIPLGMGAAALAGLVNGVGVAYGGLPPFIMTLGMLSFARGLAFIYTGGTPIPINNESFYAFGNGYFAGVPIPSLILIATLIVSGFVLQLTPFGRSVYAIGSNEEAARLSGVPVKAYTTIVYVISGFLSGLAGLVYASQLSIGTPIAGQGYELDAIAAVVVGGTSLFGGKGSVAGTFLGTLIIGVLANILNLTGVDPFVQQLFKGALIVAAVFIMSRTKRSMSDAMSLEAALSALRPRVDRHVTSDRVRRYLSALVDTPAPSTAAGAMRVPVLNRLLAADGAFDSGRLRLDPDFGGVGSPVIFTGGGGSEKPFWAFAHLDTISYLVQPDQGGRVPLVPYCVHLMHDGECPANAYRYDLESNRYRVVAEGRIESSAGSPFFRSMTPGRPASARRSDRALVFLQRPGAGRPLYRPHGQCGRRCGAGGRRAGSRGSGRRSHAGFSRRGGRAGGSGQPNDVPGQRSHRSPSAAAEARDCRGCPAGRRRPGRRHEGRRRKLNTAGRRGRSLRILEPRARRRHASRSLWIGPTHGRCDRRIWRAGAGIEQRLFLAQRRRERDDEDAQRAASRLSGVQPAFRSGFAARASRRRDESRESRGLRLGPRPDFRASARRDASGLVMIDIATVGWLTMDDIVLLDHSCRPGVLGGGALYSAIGAQIWSESVGVHSVTGREVYEDVRARIASRGLDGEGVGAIEGAGLQLWLLHESETFKRQVPKLNSATAEEMDRGRGPLPEAYRGARGFHVAPQTPAGTAENVRTLSELPHRPVVTVDILSDEYIDRRVYADFAFVRGASAFLPSEQEIMRIWDPPDIAVWLRETASRLKCHMVAKLGERGSLVCDAESGVLIHTPAHPVQVVDTTGAGDGYCGGFVAGLAAGRPLAECAAMGAVSASYVIEACGALETERPSVAARQARLQRVLAETRYENP